MLNGMRGFRYVPTRIKPDVFGGCDDHCRAIMRRVRSVCKEGESHPFKIDGRVRYERLEGARMQADLVATWLDLARLRTAGSRLQIGIRWSLQRHSSPLVSLDPSWE